MSLLGDNGISNDDHLMVCGIGLALLHSPLWVRGQGLPRTLSHYEHMQLHSQGNLASYVSVKF